MITREEFLTAADMIHSDLIDVLAKWMKNEKGNLDSFLESPTDHILYNPFVIPDTVALAQRSALLGQAVDGLNVMSAYKKGIATQTQRDYVLDRIPYQLFARLLGWMENRYADYVKTTGSANVGAPISEYGDLITFNMEAYLVQMNMYKDAIDGVKIIIEYKTQGSL